MTYTCVIPSPIGPLHAAGDGESITGLWIEGQKYFASTLEAGAREGNPQVFMSLRSWLDGYFLGNRTGPPPPLNPEGSAFRRSVWDILRNIPYGEVTTYGEIAKRLEKTSGGKRISARAVGGAVGHNPISILIPCHRVVGAGGSLTGYAGGIERKIYLLKLENAPVTKLPVLK